MTESTKVAIIYYSATGNVHALAQGVAQGAAKAGAEVRVRRVRRPAPADAIDSRSAGTPSVAGADVPKATPQDVEWADAVVLGTPARYGQVAGQLQQFIDAAGALWSQGRLADKVYAAFTSTSSGGGAETAIVALNSVFTHWGGLIVPPGYTDPVVFEHGNPYGVSHIDGNGLHPVGEVELLGAAHLGARVAEIATVLKRGRSPHAETTGPAHGAVPGQKWCVSMCQ